MDFLIIMAVTADVMFAAMACGTVHIRIPFFARACMAAVSSGFLIISAAGKSVLFDDLPQNTIRWIGFCALMCIGLMQIFGDSIAAALARTQAHWLAPLRMGATVFRDQTAADLDGSKALSCGEAVVLAIPVSIDSLIGGLGIATRGFQLFPLLVVAFFWNFFAVWYGRWFGTKIPFPSERVRSLACGLTLMALGVCKLL